MELVFPRDNSKLREMFLKAACPAVDELEGLYRVDMLTGLKLPRNFKMIADGKGYNLLFGSIKWGHFIVENGMTRDFERALVFNYETPENIVTRRIRDYVRRVAKDVYLGVFNYVIFGTPEFVGYFTLITAISEYMPEETENAL